MIASPRDAGYAAVEPNAMQVLYVEDDQELAASVQMMLHRRGHFCHTTGLGEEALRLVKRNEYDIVVLDIMLPDIDGYDVLERMERQGASPACLLQSGLIDRDADPKALGFGVDVFLSKPFTIDELLERISKVLDGSPERVRPGGPPLGGVATPRRRPGSERRAYRRFATVKQAVAVAGGERHECVVLNMSHGGAALRLADGWTSSARHLTLELAEEPPRECQVCWCLGNKIGIRFL